jgi:hypothetical protein
MEMKTARYSSDVSQTALALLALLAAGKDIEPAAIRALLEKHAKSEENLFLTVFSDQDTEEWDRENPAIIPFTGRNREQHSYSNAYGTLSLRNGYQKNPLDSHRSSEIGPKTHLRIFSPDIDDDTTDEESFCTADSATSCMLRVYNESAEC